MNKKWCKQCGICDSVCPKNVLAIGEDGKPYPKDPAACSGCGPCELRCPDFARALVGAEHD
ncbi:MAG: 4Fe-4S dicluster domain-containing protein [Dethiobacter sp.]